MHFNEYVERKDTDNLLETVLKDLDCYNAIFDLAKRDIVSEQALYNELWGGMSALGQAGWNAGKQMAGNMWDKTKSAFSSMTPVVNNAYQNVKSGIQQAGQNVANIYNQGEQKNKIQQASRKVTELQKDLSGLGFTDEKVHNFLKNVGNVLQTGLGRNLSYQGNIYKPGGADFNKAAEGLRDMVRQGRQKQMSGWGI